MLLPTLIPTSWPSLGYRKNPENKLEHKSAVSLFFLSLFQVNKWIYSCYFFFNSTHFSWTLKGTEMLQPLVSSPKGPQELGLGQAKASNLELLQFSILEPTFPALQLDQTRMSRDSNLLTGDVGVAHGSLPPSPAHNFLKHSLIWKAELQRERKRQGGSFWSLLVCMDFKTLMPK